MIAVALFLFETKLVQIGPETTVGALEKRTRGGKGFLGTGKGVMRRERY